MVTREDVARACGVSTMTVTRVASGKGYVKEETKKKVNQAIKSMGYFPNKVASHLAQKKSNEIAIILPDLTNPYYLQVIDAIIREATKHSHVATIFKASEENISEVLEEIVSNRVAGVVNYSAAFPEKYVKVLKEMEVRVIRSNGYDVEIGRVLDYNNAIKTAIGVLKSKGAKNIIFVSGMSEKYLARDPRYSLFLKNMKACGLETNSNSIIYGNYPEEKAFIVGYNIAKTILEGNNKPDAVFCINDMMAFGFISAAKRKGIKLPDELAIVGFDNIYLSAFYEPSLSTIDINIEKEARLYVDYIVSDKIETSIYQEAEFIERDSTNFLNKN